MTTPVRDDLLIAGLDDWVDLATIIGFALHSLGLDSMKEAEGVGLRLEVERRTYGALREVLERGLMEAGDLIEAENAGNAFVSWGVGIEEALARVRRLWEKGKNGWFPDAGPDGWLNNTPEGDRLGHELRQSRWFDLADLVGVWTSRYRTGSMELVLCPDATFSTVVGFSGSTPPFSFAGEWSYDAGTLELRPFYLFSPGVNTPMNLEVERLAAYRDPQQGAVVLGRELEFRKTDL